MDFLAVRARRCKEDPCKKPSKPWGFQAIFWLNIAPARRMKKYITVYNTYSKLYSNPTSTKYIHGRTMCSRKTNTIWVRFRGSKRSLWTFRLVCKALVVTVKPTTKRTPCQLSLTSRPQGKRTAILDLSHPVQPQTCFYCVYYVIAYRCISWSKMHYKPPSRKNMGLGKPVWLAFCSSACLLQGSNFNARSKSAWRRVKLKMFPALTSWFGEDGG